MEYSAAIPLLVSTPLLLTKCWLPTRFLKKSTADYAPSLRSLTFLQYLPKQFAVFTTESLSVCCSSTIKMSIINVWFVQDSKLGHLKGMFACMLVQSKRKSDFGPGKSRL